MAQLALQYSALNHCATREAAANILIQDAVVSITTVTCDNVKGVKVDGIHIWNAVWVFTCQRYTSNNTI